MLPKEITLRFIACRSARPQTEQTSVEGEQRSGV
jgi:hypothetical protein